MKKVTDMLTETTERVYDLMRDTGYEVAFDKKKKAKIAVKQVRPTRHTIKWRAKGY